MSTSTNHHEAPYVAVLEVNDLELESDDQQTPVSESSPKLEPKLLPEYMKLLPSERKHFMIQLADMFWHLLAARPANPMIAPACLPGLTHVDATVGALVDVIHAFTLCDLENIGLATKLYTRLLLHPVSLILHLSLNSFVSLDHPVVLQDPTVSFACKHALLRALRPKHRRRKVFIPSPPRCSTPGKGNIRLG